jgi:NTP pyrophosphatase (non-canonical NTP hydrolase)
MWSDSETTISEMQRGVASFIDERDWGRYHAPVNVASAISVEAAELLELFQWRRSDDPVPEDVVREAAGELADVLHFTLCMANSTKVSLASAERTVDQVLEADKIDASVPKAAAEEVMVGAAFVLMAARATDITLEIADKLEEGGAQEAMVASIEFLLSALARCSSSMGLDLARELELKNELNEKRFPVGTRPDVGY